MTLIFDLVTPKVDRFNPVGHLCQFVAKLVHLFSNCLVHKFANGRTNDPL